MFWMCLVHGPTQKLQPTGLFKIRIDNFLCKQCNVHFEVPKTDAFENSLSCKKLRKELSGVRLLFEMKTYDMIIFYKNALHYFSNIISFKAQK